MNQRMELTFKFAIIRGRNAARSSSLQTENGVGPFMKRGGRNERGERRDDRGKEG